MVSDNPEVHDIDVHIERIAPGVVDALTNGSNVLFFGRHGVGKTDVVNKLTASRGKRVKYYSCATLDPYTDLVGVPVPVDSVDRPGHKDLHMARPLSIDEAEIAFFDELNRAQPQTLNAVLEIVQFGTINGEPLPNLEACWGAMNPPSDREYDVIDVDPALMDRFDLYVTINPSPSVEYMTEIEDIPESIAKALVNWWHENVRSLDARRLGNLENYISPRRLTKWGKLIVATNDPDIVRSAWPPQADTEMQSMLIDALGIAVNPKLAILSGEASALEPPNSSLVYDRRFMFDVSNSETIYNAIHGKKLIDVTYSDGMQINPPYTYSLNKETDEVTFSKMESDGEYVDCGHDSRIARFFDEVYGYIESARAAPHFAPGFRSIILSSGYFSSADAEFAIEEVTKNLIPQVSTIDIALLCMKHVRSYHIATHRAVADVIQPSGKGRGVGINTLRDAFEHSVRILAGLEVGILMDMLSSMNSQKRSQIYGMITNDVPEDVSHDAKLSASYLTTVINFTGMDR